MAFVKPKEVKEALAILDEAEAKLAPLAPFGSFGCVRKRVEGWILGEPEIFANWAQKRGMSGMKLRGWIFGSIAKNAGDELESGSHHIWRGALNTDGEELLLIYDAAADEMVSMGQAEAGEVEEAKADIRRVISEEG